MVRKLMTRLIMLSMLIGVSGLLWAPSAHAIALNFVPNIQTVNLSDVVTVDIVISDLGSEIVSAYDLDVSYDMSILTATGVSFGTELDLGVPGMSLQSSFLLPGVVDLAELSFWDDATLQAFQLDTFTLATLSFDAIGIGTSALNFDLDPIFGIDVKGLNADILPLTSGDSSVVVEAKGVPEPATLLLMGFGLVGLAGLRKKMLS